LAKEEDRALELEEARWMDVDSNNIRMDMEWAGSSHSLVREWRGKCRERGKAFAWLILLIFWIQMVVLQVRMCANFFKPSKSSR
jgi:hypothetical protein